MAFFGASSTSANVSSTGDKDIEVAEPPVDDISSLSFCPVADFLAVGSWDNNVSHSRCSFTLPLDGWMFVGADL
jgi:mRNA export factor